MTPDAAEVPLRRNRDFLILWAGQAFSDAGTAMSSLVFPLLGYAITHSTLAAGAVTTAVVIGRVVARVLSGALVDRWSRKRVLVVGNTAAGVAFLAGAAAWSAGLLRLPVLLVVAVVAGTADAFIGPAASAGVRAVVPTHQLPGALARLQARHQVAQLVGPPVGGALFAISHGLPLAVDAFSYVVFAVASTALTSPLRAARDRAGRVLTDAKEGFAFMWRHAAIRSMMTWGGLFNFAMGYVYIALTLRLLRAGVHPAAIGGIEAVSAVAGLAGAVVAPTVVSRARSGRLTIATAILLAVIVTPVAFTTNVVIVATLFALGTFLIPANNSAIGGYMAAATPDRLQARVFAASGIFSLGFATAAPLAAGAVLGATGGTTALVVGAALIAFSITPLLTNAEVLRLGKPAEWPTAEQAESAPALRAGK